MKKSAFIFVMLLPALAFAGAYEDMEQAVIRRDASSVIDLLGRGMDINTVDRTGDTLLIQAVRLDMPELIDYLIQRRARLNCRNRNGETALSIAAFVGKLPYVQKIVEAGAEVNFYGWPPLSYAAFNGHLEIAEYLLKRGAEIDAKTQNGSTALFLAARNGHIEVVKLLLNNQADPLIANENDETPVDAAAKGGNSVIEGLLRSAGGRSGKSVVIDFGNKE
ncbi:MAG: ankyrin repeat domain-containing protein [Betaproteobacteria bacterium]